MKKVLALWMVVLWYSPGISQAVLSHMMTDPGTTQAFSDDFEDGMYTDKWTTYTNASAAVFKEEGGYLHAQVVSGEPWTNAHFYTIGSVDVSAATGKKTEVVMSLCNYMAYTTTRNYLLNTQNPWGQGFCIEHQMYPYGRIRLSLYNNGIASYLYDSGDMGSYQYGYSVSLVVDPKTGNWSFGWANGLDGVTTPVASGTFTAEQMATHLSSSMYIGAGIYTEWSGDVNSNINRAFDVAVYQVTKTVTPTFSPWGPYVHGATTVAISSATPNAQIY